MADRKTSTFDIESGELVERPLNADELEALDAADADELELRRARASELVRVALAGTDRWAARAFEEGAPMAADRVAYRQQLRDLLPTIAAASFDELDGDVFEVPLEPGAAPEQLPAGAPRRRRPRKR